MKVKDVMIPIGEFPVVNQKTILKEALTEMGAANLGLVCIVNEYNNLMGLITDGDLRRKLLIVQKPFSSFFIDDVRLHAKENPITCSPETDLKEAIDLMEQKQVWDLPVVESDNKLIGLLHLHSAIKTLLK